MRKSIKSQHYDPICLNLTLSKALWPTKGKTKEGHQERCLKESWSKRQKDETHPQSQSTITEITRRIAAQTTGKNCGV